MSKNTRTRILLTAVAALLLVVMTVGGTLAWLTDSSNQITNTFTETTINVSLNETKDEFEMVPGRTIAKDPKVTLATGSEESYIFVEIAQSANFESYMKAYEMAVDADGKALWTLVTTSSDANGIITKVWKYNEAVAAGTELQVLKKDQVTVLETVTKQMMDDITDKKVTNPTLTIKAYAIQTEIIKDKNWTDAQIWQLAQTDGSQAAPN